MSCPISRNPCAYKHRPGGTCCALRVHSSLPNPSLISLSNSPHHFNPHPNPPTKSPLPTTLSRLTLSRRDPTAATHPKQLHAHASAPSACLPHSSEVSAPPSQTAGSTPPSSTTAATWCGASLARKDVKSRSLLMCRAFLVSGSSAVSDQI